MKDIDIVMKCAEMMGLLEIDAPKTSIPESDCGIYVKSSVYFYDPLHDKAQAMDLVIKLRLHITDMQDGNGRAWGVYPGATGGLGVYSPDLLRAVCECVANIKGKT